MIAMSSDQGPDPGMTSGLRRHIPELAIDWLAETPGKRWQILDGTLCFADISGFTALAERLAQHGRMGGEELVETLGRVFTTMLGIARERGGMLLKFGGDALLLFFQGDDHVVQAAGAAVEMRKALRAAARMPSSVGPINLSMSIGLHSGDAHFFLVGTTHRELLLLGPAANAVIEAENTANAGQIVVSTATAAALQAAALPRKTLVRRADGAQLLNWRKAPVDACGPRAYRCADRALLESLFPAELGPFLEPGPPDPQHRIACIAFVRFSGTDALLQRAGAEALSDALDQTLGPIQQILHAEHVSLLAVDVDRDGGKLFMASGVPNGQVDDEGVMLRALRRIADQRLPLPVQMGVNRGHVFAAEIGDRHRAAFSAMGDTTNTAARIAAKAPSGKIYAHPSTLDESLTRYAATPAEPLMLKGKRAPLVVYEVGAELGLRERQGLEVDVLVGRQLELARLREVGTELAGGRGAVISIVGEMGIGKTRLLKETMAGIAVETVLSLRGEPYGSSSPYGMFRDPLRTVLGVGHGDSAAMRASLAKAVERYASGLMPMLSLIGDVVQIPVEPTDAVLAIEPRFRPERTGDVVVALLEAIRAGSWTFVVDDAHWSDESSVVLLNQLARGCETHPWLMLVSRRPGSGGFSPSGGEQIELGPLSDAEIAELVHLATDAAPLRPYEVEGIVRRAGGYPLFAQEMVRAVRDVGSLEAVPESLEAAMSAQVDALDPPARRVLQYASVLGQSFPIEVLSDVLAARGFQLDGTQIARLDELLVSDGDDGMRFGSALLRDTVYGGLAYRLRRRLHEVAGEAMERRAEDPHLVADVLALHFSRSGDLARTWHYGRIAGDQARAKFANADAARFYELALAAARELANVDRSECVRLWRDLGYARLDAGQLEDALEAHRRALKLTGKVPLERAQALYHLAKTKDYQGTFSSALRDLSHARRILEVQDSTEAGPLLARVEALRAVLLMALERPREALKQTARAKATAEGVGGRASLASALTTEALARLQLEGPSGGWGLRQALAIFEELGEIHSQAVVRSNLGMVAAIAGRWDEAAEWFGSGRELFLRSGDAIDSALQNKNLGELLLSRGRLNEAEALLTEALRVMRACGWTEGIGAVETQMGQLLIERGALDEADELLVRTAAESTAIGQPQTALEAIVIRAAGRVLAGECELALSMLPSEPGPADEGSAILGPRVALVRALACARLGRLDEARRACRAGREAARAHGLPYEEGLLGRAAMDIARLTDGPADPGAVEAARQLDDLGVVRLPNSYSLSTEDALPCSPPGCTTSRTA